MNYVQFFPLRAIAIVVLVAVGVFGAIVTAVARGPGSHRIAATLGVIGVVAAVPGTAATVWLASGGFNSCWTF